MHWRVLLEKSTSYHSSAINITHFTPAFPFYPCGPYSLQKKQKAEVSKNKAVSQIRLIYADVNLQRQRLVHLNKDEKDRKRGATTSSRRGVERRSTESNKVTLITFFISSMFTQKLRLV